jgi:hypothetical protein
VRKTRRIIRKPKLLMFDLQRVFLDQFNNPQKSGTCFQFPFEFDLGRYLNRSEEPHDYLEIVENSQREKVLEDLTIGNVLGKFL